MTANEDTIAAVRCWGMGLTGLCCALYAVLALVQNRPDPLWWFIPGVAGAASALATAAIAVFAGRSAARAATDELHDMVAGRAQRHAFWVALGLYPVFALLVYFAGIRWDTTFAAMGTLTAACYLLLFFAYDRQTR